MLRNCWKTYVSVDADLYVYFKIKIQEKTLAAENARLYEKVNFSNFILLVDCVIFEFFILCTAYAYCPIWYGIFFFFFLI